MNILWNAIITKLVEKRNKEYIFLRRSNKKCVKLACQIKTRI